jgi:hypothetical protein
LADKVQLKAYITSETDKRFREMLARKWQTYVKGLYSYEVEQAILQYLATVGLDTEARTHINNAAKKEERTEIIQKANPLEAARNLRNAIVKSLIESGRYLQQPQFIPISLLEESIINIKNVRDKRSVKSWIKFLRSNGLIKQTGDAQYELV